MNEQAQLRRRIESLPGARVEEVLEVMAEVERWQALARDFNAELKAALIDYIDANGEIELGDKRWYVGLDKSYRPAVPLPQLVALLMDVTGGDFDRFCELLSANAFKPGECKKLLGDAFSDAFETIVKKDLETGKPRRVVKVADERFAR